MDPAPPTPDAGALPPDRLKLARSSHLLSGDPLRGLALLSVIAYHTASATLFLRTGGQDFPASFGAAGRVVMEGTAQAIFVFFSLSAYLLGRPFVAAAMGHRPWPDLGVYALRRAARILPAFWVACALVLVLYGMQDSTHRQLLAMVTLLQVYDPGAVSVPLGHAWSLDVEAVFYVVLPLGAVACAALAGQVSGAARKAAVATAVVLVVVLAGYALTDVGMDPTPAVHSPLGLLRAFAPGILLAVLDVHYGQRLVGWRHGRAVAFALLTGGLLLTYGGLVAVDNFTQGAVWIGTVAGGLLVAGVLLLQRTTGRVWRLIDNPATQWFGERSYSVFLLHGIATVELRSLYEDRGSTPALGALIGFGPIVLASCAGAYFLHRVVEVPFRTWAHKVRRTGAPLGASGAPVLPGVGGKG